MFIWGGPLFSRFATNRIVTITGGPGTYKSSMAYDLAEQLYLRPKKYAFRSAARAVWNDPDYYPLKRFIWDDPILSPIARLEGPESAIKIAKDNGLPDLMPWVYRKFFVMEEGGGELRAWKYFGDMSRFPRKFRIMIAIPSLKMPHVDLCTLVVINSFLFEEFIPAWRWGGGLYQWLYNQGGGLAPMTGLFMYFPERLGVYDTDDLSEDTTPLIYKFTNAFDY